MRKDRNWKEMTSHLRPNWAERTCNPSDGYTAIGSQLCTRDGRKTGNAVIVGSYEVETNPDNKNYNNWTVYEIYTDVGNKILLQKSEIKAWFFKPKYIVSEDEYPLKRIENKTKEIESEFLMGEGKVSIGK